MIKVIWWFPAVIFFFGEIKHTANGIVHFSNREPLRRKPLPVF